MRSLEHLRIEVMTSMWGYIRLDCDFYGQECHLCKYRLLAVLLPQIFDTNLDCKDLEIFGDFDDLDSS